MSSLHCNAKKNFAVGVDLAASCWACSALVLPLSRCNLCFRWRRLCDCTSRLFSLPFACFSIAFDRPNFVSLPVCACLARLFVRSFFFSVAPLQQFDSLAMSQCSFSPSLGESQFVKCFLSLPMFFLFLPTPFSGSLRAKSKYNKQNARKCLFLCVFPIIMALSLGR